MENLIIVDDGLFYVNPQNPSEVSYSADSGWPPMNLDYYAIGYTLPTTNEIAYVLRGHEEHYIQGETYPQCQQCEITYRTLT